MGRLGDMDIVTGQRWRWPEDPIVEGIIIDDDPHTRTVKIRLDKGRIVVVPYDELLDHWEMA